ncbi:ABC-2 type transport system ATP-binding protein [Actinocorallia herbida]|uniref:ABC-2 type transport system ATP-binding protein n=1 Tax=Actinocorallia herbida TaxID=58109 RepID=A0A3N1CPK0_9ACTN|nr:ATP-binding cassette domain-containing protein [Actinocorallia herbida]ROO83241.1 ABC-2 type transport system ATP-binding protein [Actinocorallia herbida]
MITLRDLTKRYGDVTAVDGLSARIEPGRVTGFLGPNGAGKSTTMRMILGLDAPTRGSALVGGRPYRELRWPLREVGALLDARAVHPGRSARNHLLALARAGGLPAARVTEVLETVGLGKAAHRRAGTFSLGMSQRLGIAAALLGDPPVLLFDEPVNGLDPDGVRWIRTLMRSLAAEGRTVLLSSHLMSEMQLTADHLVVVGRGRLLADTTVAALVADGRGVRVTSPDDAGLAALADRLPGARRTAPGTLHVADASVERIGDLAYELGVRLHGLAVEEASLEQKYMELTGDSVEYGVPA